MNLFDLNGKTALITGASSGLGEQFSKCLSDAGAKVILAARHLDKLTTLANQLTAAIPVQMDVRDKNSVNRALQELENSRNKIDICINNAGIFIPTPVFADDLDGDFESMMQTNVMGVWYVTKAVAQHMKQHQIHGSIINISSINGVNRLKAERSGYCASKAAVVQMTKALVGELSPHHIRINCIVPGSFHTPATDYKIKTPELRQELESSIPLGFFANPNELDGTVLYLACNNASHYVTGSSITVDGGVSWN